MAEFYFRKLISDAGLDDCFEVASAGVNVKEAGQPVYPLAKRQLAGRGIGCKNKVSQTLTPAMFRKYDCVVAVDTLTVQLMKTMLGAAEDVAAKTTRLLDYVPADNVQFAHRDVSDPCRTRRFEETWEEVKVGCDALFACLSKQISVAADETK